MKRMALLAVGAALSLTVTGCSDSGGNDQKGASPGDATGTATGSGGGGQTPTAAAFPGEPPPGVAGASLWSAPLPYQTVAEPVGASVALISPHDDRTTIELRDAATGTSRATVETAVKPTSTTWHGRPALVAQGVRKTPSDGISPEKYTWEIDVFDDQGKRIVHKEYPGQDKPRIVDGRRIMVEHGTGSNPGTLVISDAGGDAPGWRIPCEDRMCASESTTISAGVVVHHHSDMVHGGPLAGFDAATGAPLWTSQSLERPAGVDATAEPEIVEQDSGKLVTAWYFGTYGTPRFHTVAYGVNDPTTGKLLATGPALSGTSKSGLSNADGTVVVVVTTNTTAAWETGTGKLLWQQAEDEKRLEPKAVVGPVLYSGENPAMAVDLRTKAVLQRTVSDMPVPVGTGHAVVTRNPGVVYAFAVQEG